MKLKIAGLISVLSFIFAVIPGIRAEAAVSDWQKGVSIQPASATDFASNSFQQSIDAAAATGVNHITLIIPVYQSDIYSTDVAPGPGTPTDEALSSAARFIKSRGMSVSFAVHANNYDGQWRALINPGDRAAWFANYGSILNHYATLAQSLGVDQYVLGTELSSMTDPSVNASNTDYWNDMIAQVRARYSGAVTYSAQHSYYKSDLMSLDFWPALDKIGISAYYGLSDEANPTVESVKASWENWNNTQVRAISEQHNKPVLFTEVGYVSRDYALRDPGSAFALDTPYNGQIQATGYRALFEYWDSQPHMQGVSLWDWKSDPNAGGEGDRDYTPQNKPAAEVMKEWFGGAATAPTPSPAPAPTPAPAEPATYTATAEVSGQPVVNSTTTISATVTASQPVNGVIVDIEIYNTAGQQVHQQAYDNESLSSTSKNFSAQFTPASTGEFNVKIGIFSGGWQSNLYWNDSAHKFTVGETVSEPAPSEPASPQPAPVKPGPEQPQTDEPASPAPSTLSIWWPGEGSSVSGLQPFKAVLDGRELSQYQMYWQVDGGVLNLMGDGSDPVPHKLSYVDLTNWNWNANGQYTIRFVAHDLAGNVIGEKTVVITVTE